MATNGNIRITAIDVTYAQDLTDLGRRLFADTFSKDNLPENIEVYLDEAYKVEIQTKELTDPNLWTFMAFDQDTPVAFMQLRQKDDVYEFIGDSDALELQRIYVDKSYAGKGIGKLLMAACLQQAKELNKKTVWLGVWEHNPTAIKFYKRHGFYQVGTHIFKLGEQEDTDHIMIKKI